MSFHITYNDGSNPLFMVQGTEKQVLRELRFQKERNGHLIKSVYIFNDDLVDITERVWAEL